MKFADKLRNCEDALLDEAMGLAILSCDVGRDKWNTVMVRWILLAASSRLGMIALSKRIRPRLVTKHI